MKAINRIEGRAYPLGLANVDTDAIISAEYLKKVTRKGMGEGAFATMRRNPDNIFDNPEYAGAPILVAGENFGCGSSREHAAWAILDMGVQAVIAVSFSDIFSGNAFKNGILTIELPQAQIDMLLDAARDGQLAIDLPDQTVTTESGNVAEFGMDPFRKHCLINGLDEIGLTLQMEDAISRHEREIDERMPWLSSRRDAA
ncbi:3-isopropylmalate dehydratase small subunit [Croceicoccus sediminis]|uniref:3-isopropylmalate dehydratase small subunit n=1 Tax=Croceicoccus sediminis TaxID=2571150 RepID=UPI001183AEBB|nr:3-isopropylmalate dehydratase small subunit [Croceicoccus sediminis]